MKKLTLIAGFIFLFPLTSHARPAHQLLTVRESVAVSAERPSYQLYLIPKSLQSSPMFSIQRYESAVNFCSRWDSGVVYNIHQFRERTPEYFIHSLQGSLRTRRAGHLAKASMNCEKAYPDYGVTLSQRNIMEWFPPESPQMDGGIGSESF